MAMDNLSRRVADVEFNHVWAGGDVREVVPKIKNMLEEQAPGVLLAINDQFLSANRFTVDQ